MKKFTYWKNKSIWHEAELLTVIADNISEADKEFKQKTNIDPMKTPWVGTTVEEQTT